MLETGYRHNDDLIPKTKEMASDNLVPANMENQEAMPFGCTIKKLGEVWEKRRIIDQKAIKEVKIFVDALDSYKKWLTRRLLNIHKNLKEVKWLDETTLWNKSFEILLSINDKTIARMPNELKWFFGAMLESLARYDDIKNNKAIPLEKKMLACLSMNTISDNYAKFWDRIFIPWNIGMSTSDSGWSTFMW